MKKVLPLFVCMLVGLVFSSLAQINVKGKVTSGEDGEETLPGVTVLQKGTANGTVSDINGNYDISVPEDAVLTYSFVGFETKEVRVGGRSVIDVSLQVDITSLNEVVVTAFGIEKSKKSLGYSQTEIEGDELTTVKEVTIASQLTGKVAGLNISRPNTGPAGSTSVIIRGRGALTGTNQALIVIDGVPVDNTSYAQANADGGIDRGDVFASINPDDIASISVLKGATAGTLYGERGANGVLIITTKKGSKELSIEYNGNYTFDLPANFGTFYQNQYGQGRRGEKPDSQTGALNNWQSWGAKLDGSDMVYFDGVTRPYVAAPENDVLNYLRTGTTFTNNLSISGGSELMTTRLSVSSLENKGIVPESGYERYTVNLLSSLNYKNKLRVEMKTNYIEDKAENRTNLADNGSNPAKTFAQVPSNISNAILRDNIRDPNAIDRRTSAIPWNNNPFILNPYWGPFENQQEDSKRRLIGYFLAKYHIIDQLSFQFRYAVDWTRTEDLYVEQEGTEFTPQGAFGQGTGEYNDRTLDIILNYTGKISSDIGINASLGAVRNPRSSKVTNVLGKGFIAPELYDIRNFEEKTPVTPSLREVQTNGLYGIAMIDFKQLLYLEGSLREDTYSTLTNPRGPEFSDNNSFYGSLSLSFILSDAISLPSFTNFFKLRGTYGTAGNGTPDPYKLQPTYIIEGNQYDSKNGQSFPLGSIALNEFANPFVQPTITRSLEFGLEARFLNDRLGIDVAYYRQNTLDQLLNVNIPTFTGFNETFTNAGDVENKGIEVLIDATPVKSGFFRWDLSFNYTTNKNTVLRLAEGIDALVPAGYDPRPEISIVSRVGQQPFNMEGTAFKRDKNGSIVHDENGLPIVVEGKRLGNFNPYFYGGLTNTFSYKDFTLSVIIDYKQGGKINSASNGAALASGKHIETLKGRDNPFFQIIGEGVTESGEPNTQFVFLDQYYGRLAGIAEHSTFDASFIKVRQATLTYKLPYKIIKRTPFKAARFGITGRNLFFIQNGISHLGLDPEALYNTNNYGLEFATLPTTRSIGFNLNFKF